jgi:hypothetical protein
MQPLICLGPLLILLLLVAACFVAWRRHRMLELFATIGYLAAIILFWAGWIEVWTPGSGPACWYLLGVGAVVFLAMTGLVAVRMCGQRKDG